jgi:gas vesicle protein
MEQKNQNNGFGSGFVLGLLVGVIVTLLVTTKKGRELFREFTEKGLDKFSDLEDKLQETKTNLATDVEDFEEMGEESDYIPLEEPQSVTQPAKAKETTHNGHAPKSSHIRRFFRSKKS